MTSINHHYYYSRLINYTASSRLSSSLVDDEEDNNFDVDVIDVMDVMDVTGDYLGTIQNFEHIDGDCIGKMSHTNDYWKKIMSDQ